MATYDLQEQEQIEELKTWWKLHGTIVTVVVTAIAVGMVGWQGWQWWQNSQMAQASQIYGGLQQALMQQDVKRVRQLSGELIEKYSGTAYAGMAAMLAGKTLMESGDLKSAQAQFGWVAENASDPGLRDLGRLRQAIALAEDQAYDEALKLLAVPPAPTFMARFLEVRGDVLLAQGKGEEARKTYDEALKQLDSLAKTAIAAETAYRDMVEAKRDAAGGAS
jgi:predicted negative regulator of RcsB-dependent stress response